MQMRRVSKIRINQNICRKYMVSMYGDRATLLSAVESWYADATCKYMYIWMKTYEENISDIYVWRSRIFEKMVAMKSRYVEVMYTVLEHEKWFINVIYVRDLYPDRAPLICAVEPRRVDAECERWFWFLYMDPRTCWWIWGMSTTRKFNMCTDFPLHTYIHCVYVFIFECIYICLCIHMFIHVYIYIDKCFCVCICIFIRYTYRDIDMNVYTQTDKQMCIYICKYIYVHTQIYIHMYIYVYIYMYMYIIYTYICIFIYICMCMHVYIYIYMYIYVYIYMYIYMYVYTYVYI